MPTTTITIASPGDMKAVKMHDVAFIGVCCDYPAETVVIKLETGGVYGLRGKGIKIARDLSRSFITEITLNSGGRIEALAEALTVSLSKRAIRMDYPAGVLRQRNTGRLS
jgi:hypothetical protein